MRRPSLFLTLVAAAALAACSRPTPPDPAPGSHVDVAPHGGTVITLGDEVYRLELLRDPASGTLTAYVLDGEMENFIRIAQPSLTLTVSAAGGSPARTLSLRAVPNRATGETVGNTSQFEAAADWVRTTPRFEGEIGPVNIRGSAFPATPFRFPEGNESP